MRIPLRSNRQRQQVTVAILIALSMTVMIGFVGLALDLGKLYVLKVNCKIVRTPVPWPPRRH